jgi:hypothetical protein
LLQFFVPQTYAELLKETILKIHVSLLKCHDDKRCRERTRVGEKKTLLGISGQIYNCKQVLLTESFLLEDDHERLLIVLSQNRSCRKVHKTAADQTENKPSIVNRGESAVKSRNHNSGSWEGCPPSVRRNESQPRSQTSGTKSSTCHQG